MKRSATVFSPLENERTNRQDDRYVTWKDLIDAYPKLHDSKETYLKLVHFPNRHTFYIPPGQHDLTKHGFQKDYIT